MAAQTGVVPSLVIYDSGLEALPIGGLTGTIPSPTLGQLQADIRAGRFHLVWIATDTDPRLKWIATHCVQMSPRFYTCQPADAGLTAPGVRPARGQRVTDRRNLAIRWGPARTGA